MVSLLLSVLESARMSEILALGLALGRNRPLPYVLSKEE